MAATSAAWPTTLPPLHWYNICFHAKFQLKRYIIVVRAGRKIAEKPHKTAVFKEIYNVGGRYSPPPDLDHN